MKFTTVALQVLISSSTLRRGEGVEDMMTSPAPSLSPKPSSSLEPSLTLEPTFEPSMSSEPSQEPSPEPSMSLEPSFEPSKTLQPSLMPSSSLVPSISFIPSTSSSPTIYCISTKEDLKNAIATATPQSIIPICSGTTYLFTKKEDPDVMSLTAEGVELTCINTDGSSSNTCILDGGSLNGRKSAILDVQADSFAMTGITFQNAVSKDPGSAINIVGFGGGAYIIKDCSFINNKVTDSGGAAVEVQTCVGCTRSGELTIEDCDFTGNENTDDKNAYAGALSVGNLDKTYMKRCSFALNKSALEAGGADFEQITNLQIEDCSFNENSAGTFTGALDVTLCDTVEIERCTFNLNVAGEWAGAINIETVESALISKSIFTRNSDVCKNCEEGGSAIGAFMVKSLVVEDSSFIENSSKGWGAICSVQVEETVVQNSLFQQNSAEGGGGIYAENDKTLSGITSTSLVIKDSQFSMNVAISDCGGGVETDFMDYVEYENVCFQMNQAPDGGAGCSYDEKEFVSFVDVVSDGTNSISAKNGCNDFSFSFIQECLTFPVGSCPAF